MSAPRPTRSSAAARRLSVDPWLAATLLIAVVLDCTMLTWGLPNGNQSWAADGIGPVTALGIARRTLGSWNSGWFYFKYPPGWPFLMVAGFAPYLAALWATGHWSHPTAQYPYGFAEPERALFVLAMIGRVLAVGFALALVVIAYGIARRLFDRAAARWSAFLVATSYPIVYYAHTTNLDISYCTWLILALYCAIVASDSPRWPAWAGLGLSAAMAMSTKEQGFAWLLPLPFMALAARVRQTGSARALWQRPTWVMMASGLVTLLVANNAVINPLGFAGRIAYLLGHPLQPVEARLAPVEFALWKGAKEWRYVDHLWVGLESSLGLPVLILAAIGALVVWRRPRAALWLLVPTVALYYLSLRGLELIALRYLLPVTVVALILAAALLAQVRAAMGGAGKMAANAVLALLACYALARAIEVDWLMWSDSRYAAEAWMTEHLPVDATVEIYQKPAFVPRFPKPLRASYVPMSERSRGGLAVRQPHAIVTSSASHRSIAQRWTPDWRSTGDMLQPEPAAVDFLAGLEAGELPYRVGTVVRQDPLTFHNRITSLAPEIVVYVRTQ